MNQHGSINPVHAVLLKGSACGQMSFKGLDKLEKRKKLSAKPDVEGLQPKLRGEAKWHREDKN